MLETEAGRALITLTHVKKQYEVGQKQFMAVNDISVLFFSFFN